MNDGEAFARNISGGKGETFENAFENLFHPESETVSLGGAFDFRFAETRPENGRKLAEAVEALVVHLDDHNAFEPGEDFFEADRQGMDVPQMQRANFLAMCSRQLGRVVDGPVSGTPADEEDVPFGVAVNFRDWNFFGELAEFVAALGRHRHMHLGAAGGMAHLVVLEAGDERIFPIENRGAGRDVLGDRIDGVGLE